MNDDTQQIINAATLLMATLQVTSWSHRIWVKVISRFDHPAVFPIELAEQFLRSWPRICYEPFAGSGSTILAAERVGVDCYAMELAPEYCDIAVARWEQITGEKATKKPKRKGGRR